MADSNGRVEFEAVLADDETDGDVRLGTLALSADGMLAVVDAALRERIILDSLVQGVNAKDVFHVRTPSGPGAVATAVSSRAVRRTEAQFIAALIDYVERYHGVRLRPLLTV